MWWVVLLPNGVTASVARLYTRMLLLQNGKCLVFVYIATAYPHLILNLLKRQIITSTCACFYGQSVLPLTAGNSTVAMLQLAVLAILQDALDLHIIGTQFTLDVLCL
jgi:hypothetical protein